MATLLDAPPVPDLALLVDGCTIGGRYVVRGTLGKGGFGAVFRCLHTGTGQDVAVKVLTVADASADVLTRFFREARVTAGLKHPNTIRVFDFGQDDNGVVFLAMEMLSGHSLADELRTRMVRGSRFAEREVIEIAIAVLRSLAEAHAGGLVHRDLKPHNIYLHQVPGDDPVVKVLDFGIAKSEGAGMTATGAVLGTPAYMSPEQAQSLPLDGRSDLYSLGVVLWELVTGSLPFAGATPVQTLYLHAFQPLPALQGQAKTQLSAAFAAVIERALQKKPEDRYADAQAMRQALLLALGRTTGAAVVVSEGVAEPSPTDPTLTGATPVTRRDAVEFADTGVAAPVRAPVLVPASTSQVAPVQAAAPVAAIVPTRSPRPAMGAVVGVVALVALAWAVAHREGPPTPPPSVLDVKVAPTLVQQAPTPVKAAPALVQQVHPAVASPPTAVTPVAVPEVASPPKPKPSHGLSPRRTCSPYDPYCN